MQTLPESETSPAAEGTGEGCPTEKPSACLKRPMVALVIAGTCLDKNPGSGRGRAHDTQSYTVTLTLSVCNVLI